MKNWIFILCFVGAFFSAQAQDVSLPADTMTDAEIEHMFFYKTRYQVRIGSERSIFSENNIKLNYYKFGVQFKKHYKTGLVLFGSRETPLSGVETPEVAQFNLKVTGIGAYFEYVFIENYRFSVSSPLTLGYTRIKAKAYDDELNRISSFDKKSGYYGFMSIGATATMSINYWLVLSTGFGYRQVFAASSTNSGYLSSPYYSVGFKIRVGNLWRTMFHHKEVLRMKSVYFRDKRPEKSAKLAKRARNFEKFSFQYWD